MAASPVTTTVTELPESRVRVEAEVPARRSRSASQHAAAALGRNLRVPGFRAGKVPPPVVIQRVGRDAVLDEAVRERSAAGTRPRSTTPRIVPVGEPDLDLADLPERSEPLSFSIEIGVRPTASSATTRRSRSPRARPTSATRRSPTRSSSCASARPSWRPSTARPRAATSSSWTSRAPSTATPFAAARAATRWSSWLRPARARLRGAARGRRRRRRAHGHGDLPRGVQRDRAGRQGGQFAVTVKEIKAKGFRSSTTTSPPRPASTRSTSCARTSARASRGRVARIEAEFREAALDAAVDNATSRCRRRSSRRAPASCGTGCCTRSAPGHQQGGLPADLRHGARRRSLEEAKPDAEQALRREAVLAAVIEAEGIEPSEGTSSTRSARRRPTSDDAREAAGTPEVRGASTRSRRTSPSARRSTSSPSRPSPSPPSPRRPRASRLDLDLRTGSGGACVLEWRRVSGNAPLRGPVRDR